MDQLLNWPWKEALIASTFLLGVITSLLLLVAKYPANRFLGLLLLSQIFFLLTNTVDVFLDYTWLSISSISIALYLYVKAFFEQKTRISYRHLLPLVILTFLSVIPLFTYQPLVIRVLASLFALGYVAASVNKMTHEGEARGISWMQNPGSRLSWFRNFLIFNLLTMACWLVGAQWLSEEFVIVSTLLLLVLVYSQIIRESGFLSPIILGNKYQKSTLTAAQKHAIITKLDELIKREKFYLSDTISMAKLAEQLHTTTHHLSQVINETKGISFQKLIGQYRMQEARRLLKEDAYEQTTIENIAAMVGYNSKSAFNNAFKKYTGLTPTEFRQNRGVRAYREAHLPDKKSRFFMSRFVISNHVLSLTQLNMVSNFLKIFGRKQINNKVFSFINLFGLTVGFSCSILIYLFIADELSYDRSLPESDQVYRIAWLNDNPQTRTPHPMAQAMAESFSEVEAATSLSPWYSSGLNKQSVKVKNEKKDILYEEPDFYFADSTFFEVFQLKTISGDQEALKKPWSLVITNKMASKYFGTEEAVGQQLIVEDMPLTVAAVVAGMPEKSHFHFKALIPYVSLKQMNPDNPWFKWEDFGHFNYIKTTADANVEYLERQIVDWVIPYLDWSESGINGLKDGSDRFDLQPIRDIHLKSHLRWELESNGNILYVYILTFTLVFILLIVSINYVNLTTAKSLDRAKEVGIKKTLGALPSQLKLQFYTESLLTCLIAAVLSLLLAGAFLGTFNAIAHKSFELGDIFNFWFLVKAFGTCLLIVLIAGLYPALTLTAFNPSSVLKGQHLKSGQGNRLRSALVILQFFVSAVLITGSVVVLKQINFMKTKELGFDQEAVISVKVHYSVESGSIDLDQLKGMQDQFGQLSGVKGTSAVSNLPGEQFNQNPIFLEQAPSHRIDASEAYVDFNFLEVLNLEIVSGRGFDKSHTDDVNGLNFIINESAARQLNLEQPIGKSLVWDNTWKINSGTIIGVVKDFHFRSLHEPIQPLIMRIDPLSVNHVVVKMNGQNFQESLTKMKGIYTSLEDELPFEYHFLDQQLAELYKSEVRTLNIFSIFTGVALALACLGLLGMAIAILNKKIKEVGIRKVLGASSSQIMRMILGQFTRLIALALILGIPTGYFLMQKWISEFAYQVEIGFMPFVIASVALLAIALASVSAVVLKIALSNPVDTLKYE